MITIKCFGRVEISGEGKLPLDIAIESTNEIGIMSLGVELTDDNELTAFTGNVPLSKNNTLNITGTANTTDISRITNYTLTN